MPDVTATIRSPAFRAWYNMLRSPRFLDKDVLLVAGVIANDEDWQIWTERGWLFFILKASDAQAVGLFGLVQDQLKPEQRAAVAPEPKSDRPVLIASGTKIICPGGHAVAQTRVDLHGANPAAGLKGDVICAAAFELAPHQPAFVDADNAHGESGSLTLCRCGEPWGWYGSLLTENGWAPPLTEQAELQLATKRQLIARDRGRSA